MTSDQATRIFVTGADGFVGRHLVAALLDAGFHVVAATRTPTEPAASAAKHSALSFAAMPDLGNPKDAKTWPTLFGYVDAVVHLAGIAHTGDKIREERYLRINGQAVGEIATAAEAAGVHAIYVSSVRAQTGPTAAQVIHEDTPPHPTDAYGRAKLHGETLFHAALPSGTILRPVLIYGAGVKGNMASLLALARMRTPLPLASLEGRRSVLAVENLIAAILFSLRNPVARGRRYLLADPSEAPTAATLVTLMREAMGRRPGLVPVPRVLLANAMRIAGRGDMFTRLDGTLEVDVSRLTNDGWQPVVSTREGIARMVRG